MGETYDTCTNSSQWNDSNRIGCFLKDDMAFYVLSLLVAFVGSVLILVALFLVYSMIRKDPVAPVSIINLLISDLIQLCCLIGEVTTKNGSVCCVFFRTYECVLLVSVTFMVVICMERYFCVVWPMWFRFNHSIKTSVVISIVSWVLPVYYHMVHLYIPHYGKNILLSCYLFFPCPLLTFCFYKTVKVLSASHGVSFAEKLRITFILSIIGLIYMIIILPLAISYLSTDVHGSIYPVYHFLMLLNPLADLVLYIFMRKDIFDRYLVSLCCCKMHQEEISTTVENIDTFFRQSTGDTESIAVN